MPSTAMAGLDGGDMDIWIKQRLRLMKTKHYYLQFTASVSGRGATQTERPPRVDMDTDMSGMSLANREEGISNIVW